MLPDVDPTRPGFLEGGKGGRSEAKFALVNAKVCWRSSVLAIVSGGLRVFRSCLNISDENTVGDGFIYDQ